MAHKMRIKHKITYNTIFLNVLNGKKGTWKDLKEISCLNQIHILSMKGE